MGKMPVNQFLVVPPEERMAAVEGNKDLFKAHMNQSFPSFEFMVTPVSPFESDDFQVIPIMGTAGDGFKEPGEMREEPEKWLLDDIMQVCRRFDVSGSKRRLS